VIWGLKGNTKPSFSLSLPVKETTPNCSPVFIIIISVFIAVDKIHINSYNNKNIKKAKYRNKNKKLELVIT